jgi:hypothetical protein
VAEVSDAIHLRRFCRISLSERVPDESTVRKLTRRIGAETVNELTRGLIVPAATAIGNPGEDTLLLQTVAELRRLGISPREVALDGGFNVGPTSQALEDLAPERVFISGRQQPGSKRTQRRTQGYRTGAEGTDQPPQTRLRHGPQPPERRPRPADLDRMGDPRLQR